MCRNKLCMLDRDPLVDSVAPHAVTDEHHGQTPHEGNDHPADALQKLRVQFAVPAIEPVQNGTQQQKQQERDQRTGRERCKDHENIGEIRIRRKFLNDMFDPLRGQIIFDQFRKIHKQPLLLSGNYTATFSNNLHLDRFNCKSESSSGSIIVRLPPSITARRSTSTSKVNPPASLTKNALRRFPQLRPFIPSPSNRRTAPERVRRIPSCRPGF